MSRKFESAAKLPLFFRSTGPVRSPERGCFLSKAQRPCRQQEHSCGSAAAGIPLELTSLSNDEVPVQLQRGALDAGLVMDRRQR